MALKLWTKRTKYADINNALQYVEKKIGKIGKKQRKKIKTGNKLNIYLLES